MAGKLSIDARIWFNLDDLLCFLFLVSVREVSVPADQPDPRRDEEMHRDSYELVSCSDGALSTQIKYLPTSFKSHLSKRRKKTLLEELDGVHFFSPHKENQVVYMWIWIEV